MRSPPGCLLFPLALITFIGGGVGGGFISAALTSGSSEAAVYAPLPHHVAPSPDLPAFRFAMVHDIIHERYPRHGPAFYEERERLAREKLAVLHPESEAAFALTDDIAVGFDRRGRTDEAIALMRDKLKRQQALGLEAKELYSSYANLGEFLVHGNLWAMMGGDAGAKERVKEGRSFIRNSLGAKPDAHFGLEEWQLVAIDFLISARSRSSLIRVSDLIGNRIVTKIVIPSDQRLKSYELDGRLVISRPFTYDWTSEVYFTHDATRNDRKELRRCVSQVGSEYSSAGKRAPFDEPALWLIGEWRQGSGPNPHYALCLGEIMLRVGQRYIAWNCYERASRMAEQFWPTPELQQFLRDHCKSRQTAIEKSLPAGEVAKLRPKFEAELAFGEKYQQDYQDYEEEKIHSGANLNDEHFYDEFHATHAPIASKVGPEEWYAGSTEHGRMTAKYEAFVEWGIFTGGAAVLLGSLFLFWLTRPKPPKLQLHEIV